MTTANNAPLRAKKDPTVALIMGDPKLGKTSDVLWAFPNGYNIAAPGALKPAEQIVGISIPDVRKHNAVTVKAIVERLGQVLPTGTLSILIDDLTLIVDASVRAYELQGVNKWKVFQFIRNDLMDMRAKARQLGIHVAMTLHEKKPRYDEVKTPEGGTMQRMIAQGGPNLPGQMMEGIPAVCDAILHLKKSDSLVSLWPVVYRNPVDDPRYVGVGLRELPPIDPLPANLAEILRAAGHIIPEPFPGHEETTEKIAAAMVADPDHIRKIVEDVAPKLSAKYATQVALDRVWVRRTWVLRDALARAQLRLAIARYRATPTFYGGTATADL